MDVKFGRVFNLIRQERAEMDRLLDIAALVDGERLVPESVLNEAEALREQVRIVIEKVAPL